MLSYLSEFWVRVRREISWKRNHKQLALFDVEKGVLQVTLSNDNIQTDTRKYFQSGSMKHVRYIYMRACGSGTFYDGRR